VRTWDDTAIHPGPLAASAHVVRIQSLDSAYLHYFRVETPGHMVFGLYHDRLPGVWMVDVVHD
jgi:hypothetical protein